MIIPARRVLLTLAAVTIGVGVAMWFKRDADWLAWVAVACGAASIVVLVGVGRPQHGRSDGPREIDDISRISPARRRELVRGTSLYLRELHYRYSIRLDPNETSEHRCFTAEVNAVKLGFVPVIIIDTTNERQGYGYVAFVHDGKRWRGPGLPCPAGQVEAVRHAARCVAPLAKEEETRFEERTQF